MAWVDILLRSHGVARTPSMKLSLKMCSACDPTSERKDKAGRVQK